MRHLQILSKEFYVVSFCTVTHYEHMVVRTSGCLGNEMGSLMVNNDPGKISLSIPVWGDRDWSCWLELSTDGLPGKLCSNQWLV